MSAWIRYNITPNKNFAIHTNRLAPKLPKIFKFAGVYVIFVGQTKRKYIGQGKDILKRLFTYKFYINEDGRFITPWGNFTKLEIAARPERKKFERLSTEARLIERLKPELNPTYYQVGAKKLAVHEPINNYCYIKEITPIEIDGRKGYKVEFNDRHTYIKWQDERL